MASNANNDLSDDLLLDDDFTLGEKKEKKTARQPSSDHEMSLIQSSLADISSAMKEMGAAWKTVADNTAPSSDRKWKRCDYSPDPSDHGSFDDDGDGLDGQQDDDFDVDDLLDGGAASVKHGTSGTSGKGQNDEDKILDELNAAMEDDDDVGADISGKLASIINKRFEKKLGADLRKEKQKVYTRPKNCERLKVPRVNIEVWRQLNAFQKKQDMRMANMQTTLCKATTAVALATEAILKARKEDKTPDFKDILTQTTDSMALIGHTVLELSLKRREAMKPALKREYATLCATDLPITDNLFGDDLSKTLKDIRQVNKVGKDSGRYQGHSRDQSKNGGRFRGYNRGNRRSGRGFYPCGQFRGAWQNNAFTFQPPAYNKNNSNMKKKSQ
jgi:hypothetical protein